MLPLQAEIDPQLLHTYYDQTEKRFITRHVLTGEIVGADARDFNKPTYLYSVSLAHHICNELREGKTLKEVLLVTGMPDRPTINRWRRGIPEFNEMIEAALQDRADIYHDKIIAIADDWETIDKTQAPAAKMAIDAYKWAATVGDSKKYVPSAVKGVDAQAPNITIKIDTGSKELDNMKVQISENGELQSFDIIDAAFTEVVSEESRSE